MSSKSLTDFRVRDSDRRLTEIGTQNGTKLVPKDTILMVVRGMSLKSEFRMGITQREVAFSQDLKALIPSADFDPLFLAYALRSRSDDVLGMVDESGHGTGRLQTDRLLALELPFPPLAEQRAISSVLGVLDDKIESNRRAIGILGALVSSLFTQAVSSTEKKHVPLGEITSVVKGRSYKSSELEDSPTALVTLKSIDRHGGYKFDGLKPYTGPYKPGQVVEPGEIVVAQTDLTQGAEVVGRGVRVPRSTEYSTLVASLDLAIVRPMGEMPVEYLLGLISSEGFRQHCRSHVTGTTVLHLAKDAIPTWLAPIVSLEEQQQFAVTARALLARMDALVEETTALSSLRHALLPELLSGRVRCPPGGVTV